MLIDSHCHLNLPPLSEDLPHILQRAINCGVKEFICPSVSADSWPELTELSIAHASIHPAFGIHPLWVDGSSSSRLSAVESQFAGGVAIGEIGLDYSRKDTDRELQKAVFRRQLEIGKELRLPVIIHCREAIADTLSIIRAVGTLPAGGVLHAFSGSIESAREAVKLGLQIGIAGAITWHSSVKPRQIAREIPLGHLLIETDAPDMTPERYRGSTCEPSFLPEIAEEIAVIRGISMEEVAAATTSNAKRLFNV